MSQAVTWRLDASSAQRAHLVAQAGATCTIEVIAPGAVRVFASTDDGEGVILLAGVATPAAGTVDPGFGLNYSPPNRPLDGMYLVRSAVEWSRYWEVAKQNSSSCSSGQVCLPPPLPSVDWARESLVLLASTSTGGRAPVLTEVDTSGAGRVTAVLPRISSGAPVVNAETTKFHIYHVAKLPPTTVVDYTCIEGIGCPAGGMTALPDPDPFAVLSTPPGTPTQDLSFARGPRTMLFDLPSLSPDDTVAIESFPEAAAVR